MEKGKKIMIPNKFLISTKNDGNIIEPLLKRSKNKDIVYLHYNLMLLKNHINGIHTSLSIISKLMNISNRKENIDKLKYNLKILESYGYIQTDYDIDNLKSSEYFNFAYQPFDYEDNNIRYFFTVDINIINNIMQLENGRVTYNYFNLYCYLSCRMYKLNNNIAYNMFGEYEVCMPSYDEMTKMLLINRNNLSKILRVLYDNEYVYWMNAGKYKYEDGIKQARNTYIITDRCNYKEQVKESIKFYRKKTFIEHGYEWCN